MIEIERRVHNWARWARNSRPQGHCGSVEWRYLPERGAEGVNERQDWSGIDVQDAERVERAVCIQPRHHVSLIKAVYIHRNSRGKLRHRYGIKGPNADEQLQAKIYCALSAVEYALDGSPGTD